MCFEGTYRRKSEALMSSYLLGFVHLVQGITSNG